MLYIYKYMSATDINLDIYYTSIGLTRDSFPELTDPI